MKLKIEGTIVSRDYDDDIFQSWIDRGIITPSSRIVAVLESLPEGENAELFINSYGGDVFAGAEMLIALEKAHAAGRLASVEVGALAASMAANIVAALKARGAKVAGHANTTLMFHGCYTETEGGAQHHEDVAASLRNINNAVIADLNRIGITDCRAWFAEGREKWIGAEEAVSLKLLDGFSMGAGDAPAEAKKTASRLAAFAAKVKDRTEYQMELDYQIKTATAPAGETATETPAPSVDGAETASRADSVAVAQVRAAIEKRLAGLQAAKDREINALKDELEATAKALAAAKAEVERLNAENEAQKTALAETQAALEREKEAHLAVVGAALKPAKTGNDWTDAYRAARAGNRKTK